MWDGGYFLPLLTRKRRLQAWRSFGTFLGGMASDRQPGTSSRGEKAGGWGPLRKVLRHLQCASFRHRQGRAQAIRALQSMPCTSTFTHQVGPHLDIGRHTTSLGRYSNDYLHERSYDCYQSSLL
ncbi:hypothetical protein FOQG_10594 [Fusarium oxysporum f. sp. raphani 54005]|uniref:Uncharacterized protein n=4 Tax=Fusarium oxysporum species complex TaxID=171631 RepID=X0CSN3_FUSOX|nr:hypothetical protein FOQG_10594 [Fusarium oxysporum f. sp. raphani 54005]